MSYKLFLAFALCIWCSYSFASVPSVYYPAKASPVEILAAKELQRYIYLRTGELPKIYPANGIKKVIGGSIFITDIQAGGDWVAKIPQNLKHDDFQLRSTANGGLTIIGGSDVAVLYGVYKFLESTGIGFAIDGDIIPDEQVHHIILTGFNKIYSPSFELRGIQPFHDFPEGPDWWNKDDYEAIIAQLPKLGMNFIGFHTYPEAIPFGGNYKAEPMVWIGTKENVNADGTVKRAYPVLHANTGDSTWDYHPEKTSQFHFGASQIFEADVFGADYMQNISNWPHTPDENIAIFDQVGHLLDSAFTLAKDLGVKTCIGTETPLVVPAQVGSQFNKNVNADSLNIALYEGIFTRIMKTHPLDYYWLWTPESWTWGGEEKGAAEQTEKDIFNALDALKKVNAPFTLATCGWVLGPGRDRAEFDKLLPKNIPFGVINRQTGFTPVEPSFKEIHGRPKWEISWLEDDPDLTAPQLWAGRVRKDAVDAYKYGCTGLMGIHWRTENLSPAFMALAEAGWDAKNYKMLIKANERDYPVKDIYLRWAKQQFGDKAAVAAAEIFNSLDGAPLYIEGKTAMTANFPRSAEWGNAGPGRIFINHKPWAKVQKLYGFADKFKALKPNITGTGNNERYNYWLNTFLYAKEQAYVGCLLGEMADMGTRAVKTNNKTAIVDSLLVLRQQTAWAWNKMVTCLLQTVNTTGEMGTVANLEQHSLTGLQLLNQQDSLITAVTGKPAPSLNLSNKYTGPSRIIMTTKKTLLKANDDLNFKIRVLSRDSVVIATIHWRPLGKGSFSAKSLSHISRNVFSAELGTGDFEGQDFEYYVEVKAGAGTLRYPAGLNKYQSIVVW